MLSKITRCPTCLGLGRVPPATICPTCAGKGSVDEGLQAHQRKGAASDIAKTVVTISRDEPLQMTRTALLTHAGYSVIALTSDAEVMSFISLEGRVSVNLILLCHSVPEASRVFLCKALKKAIPNAPILMLYNNYDPTLAEVDGRLENVHSPEAMLDTVQLLISKPNALPMHPNSKSLKVRSAEGALALRKPCSLPIQEAMRTVFIATHGRPMNGKERAGFGIAATRSRSPLAWSPRLMRTDLPKTIEGR